MATAPKLGDFLTAINTTKEDLLRDDDTGDFEKAYPPFIVNRCLSYFPETVLHANQMNMRHGLPKKLQFDYYRQVITKRKRFSKWDKMAAPDDLDVVKEFYGYSSRKAMEVLPILTPGQIENMKRVLHRGGKEAYQASSSD